MESTTDLVRPEAFIVINGRITLVRGEDIRKEALFGFTMWETGEIVWAPTNGSHSKWKIGFIKNLEIDKGRYVINIMTPELTFQPVDYYTCKKVPWFVRLFYRIRFAKHL